MGTLGYTLLHLELAYGTERQSEGRHWDSMTPACNISVSEGQAEGRPEQAPHTLAGCGPGKVILSVGMAAGEDHKGILPLISGHGLC